MVQENSVKKNINKLRTGVIGIGSMGQNHARIYNEISNLVGVSDVDKEQGTMLAQKYNTTYYPDYKDMLDKVDAVSIAVPTTFHSTISKDFADAGVHILVEKPLAQSTEEAKKIIDSANSNGIILSVGHIERHNEVIKYSKKCLKDGKWGNPISFSARRFSSYPNRIRDVGVVFDLTIHDVDVLAYLADSDVKSVFATGGNFMNTKYEDHAILTMEFSNKIIGLCETNWLTPIKVRDINITTDKYYVNIDYIQQEIRTFKADLSGVDTTNLFQPKIQLNEEVIKLEKIEPLKSEIEDFLNSIKNGKEPLVTGFQGLKAVEIVEKSLQSMNSGQKIDLI